MNEDYVRAMVRESIARHMPLDSRNSAPAHGGPAPGERSIARVEEPDPEQPLTFLRHASHFRYQMLPESGGPCLIEPVVRCTHCGFCQSHGF